MRLFIKNKMQRGMGLAGHPDSATCKVRTKPAAFSFALLCVLCGSILLSGCVSAHKKGRTIHERWDYSIVQSPDGPPQGVLVRHEIWRDEWTGGGRAFLADPKASGLASNHTNQIALGGSSSLAIGSFESTVSTNAVKTISDAVSQTVSDVVSKVLVPKP